MWWIKIETITKWKAVFKIQTGRITSRWSDKISENQSWRKAFKRWFLHLLSLSWSVVQLSKKAKYQMLFNSFNWWRHSGWDHLAFFYFPAYRRTPMWLKFLPPIYASFNQWNNSIKFWLVCGLRWKKCKSSKFPLHRCTTMLRKAKINYNGLGFRLWLAWKIYKISLHHRIFWHVLQEKLSVIDTVRIKSVPYRTF